MRAPEGTHKGLYASLFVSLFMRSNWCTTSEGDLKGPIPTAAPPPPLL